MSNELVQCPYDESHVIQKCRLQRHLYRCARSKPNSNKVACPFNIMHVMDKEELESHIKQCGDQIALDNAAVKVKDAPAMIQTESEENWDNEPDHPTYNPKEYVQTARVLRNINGAIPSVRKEFRRQEHLRFLELQRQNTSE